MNNSFGTGDKNDKNGKVYPTNIVILVSHFFNVFINYIIFANEDKSVHIHWTHVMDRPLGQLTKFIFIITFYSL